MYRRISLALTLVFVSMNCYATEAGKSVTQFNTKCPVQKLGALIDNYYHECHNGMIRQEYNSCERYVEEFKQLMPEYDCARPIDMSGAKKHTVPAIWLLGDGQFADYHALIHDLVFKKMYSGHGFIKARKEAAAIFFSEQFKRVVDAEGEEYDDEWNAHENKIDK